MIRFIKAIRNTRNSDCYETPSDFYAMLDREFHFTFDPCPIKPTFDGLSCDWHGVIFVNPPYSNIRPWIEKGLLELANGNAQTIVYLLPCRTDVAYFHELVYGYAELRFIRGRLKFSNRAPAPFPVYLAVYKKPIDRKRANFAQQAHERN